MDDKILVSLLLLLALLTTSGTAGAVGDRRVINTVDNGGSERLEAVESPREPASLAMKIPAPLAPSGQSDGFSSDATALQSLKWGKKRLQDLFKPAAESPALTSATTPFPEPRPLLDIDELIALEGTRQQVSTTALPPVTSPPDGHGSPGDDSDKVVFAQFEDVIKDILNTSGGHVIPTTGLPPVSSGGSITSKKPPTAVAAGSGDTSGLLSQLVEVLKAALEESEKAETQPAAVTSRPALTHPPFRPSSPPDITEQSVKDIIPLLEEELKNILDKQENITTVEPPVQLPPQQPQPVQPPPSTAVDKQVLTELVPHLEEIIKSILENTSTERETSSPQHPKRPSKPLDHRRPPSTSSPASIEKDFDDFLPGLLQALGDAFRKPQSGPKTDLSNGSVQGHSVRRPPPYPPAAATTVEPFVAPASSNTGSSASDHQLIPEIHPPSPSQMVSGSTIPSKQDSGQPAITSASDDLVKQSEPLLHALESSLKDLLDGKPIEAPQPVQKASPVTDNLVSLSPGNIAYKLDKYYQPLKKVLEKILKEEEAFTLPPATRPEPQINNNKPENKALLQALQRELRTTFVRGNETNA